MTGLLANKLTLSGAFAVIGVIFIVLTSLGGLMIHTGKYVTTHDAMYKDFIYDDLKSLVTGQHDIIIGLDGLDDIDNNPDMYVGNSRIGLIDFYKQKILMGLVFTLFYIYLFAKAIGWFFGKFSSGIETPIMVKWGMAIFIVGMLSLVVEWPSFPYHGFVAIIKNSHLLSLT